MDALKSTNGGRERERERKQKEKIMHTNIHTIESVPGFQHAKLLPICHMDPPGRTISQCIPILTVKA